MLKSLLLATSLLFSTTAFAVPSTAEPSTTDTLPCLTIAEVKEEFTSNVRGSVFATSSENPKDINELYQVLLLAYKEADPELFVDAPKAYEGIQVNWGEPAIVLMFTMNRGSLAVFIPIQKDACRPGYIWTIPMPMLEQYHQKWRNQQASE